MGVRFNLDQASLVGWLTRRDFPPPMRELDWGPWPGPWDWHSRHRRHRAFDEGEEGEGREWRAPRIKIRVLRDFLEALPESVVTSRPEDHELLRELVGKSREAFESTNEENADTVVPSSDVARILAPLRHWFDVPFYFMPLGRRVAFESYRDSTDYTMWLQCEDDRPETVSRDLLDHSHRSDSFSRRGAMHPRQCAGRGVVIRSSSLKRPHQRNGSWIWFAAFLHGTCGPN